MSGKGMIDERQRDIWKIRRWLKEEGQSQHFRVSYTDRGICIASIEHTGFGSYTETRIALVHSYEEAIQAIEESEWGLNNYLIRASGLHWRPFKASRNN